MGSVKIDGKLPTLMIEETEGQGDVETDYFDENQLYREKTKISYEK